MSCRLIVCVKEEIWLQAVQAYAMQWLPEPHQPLSIRATHDVREAESWCQGRDGQVMLWQYDESSLEKQIESWQRLQATGTRLQLVALPMHWPLQSPGTYQAAGWLSELGIHGSLQTVADLVRLRRLIQNFWRQQLARDTDPLNRIWGSLPWRQDP